MADTIPSDAVVDGGSGHEQDHDNIADMLALYAQALAQAYGGVQSSSNPTNVSAVESFVAASGSSKSHPIYIYPSGDTSGGTDVTTIQTALNRNSTAPVIMGAGHWYINKPIVMQGQGQQLWGVHGATASGDDAGQFLGTVIHIVAGFTNPTWSGIASGAILCLDQNPGVNGAGATYGQRMGNFWIDGTNSPASVDGIVVYGNVRSWQCEKVGVYKATRHCWNFVSADGANPNGPHLYSCLAQSSGGTGFNGSYTDCTMVDCHAQNNNIGFYSTGGDTRFIGCRADLSTLDGWQLDHRGAGDGYNDAVQLIGCGTQRNGNHGIRITNGSSTGSTWSDPVHIIGGSFAEDGTAAGSWASIRVEGQNIVRLTGVHCAIGQVDTGPPGVPAYGLMTGTVGSANAAPERIVISSSHLEGITALVQDNAGMGTAIAISPDTTGNSAYQSASGEQLRMGSATLVGGTVTVNSVWATPTSRIKVTITPASGTPAGFPYVSSRSAGSFVIKSTNASDTYSVMWELLTQ